MDLRTPADWVDEAAEKEPDAPALVFRDGVVTYDQLADQVHRRAGSLGDAWPDGAGGSSSIVTIPVSLDLASIVEVLAVQASGLVPLPYVEPFGGSPQDPLTDAVVAVATSGTSGIRRVVPLSMANIEASVDASSRRLGSGPESRWLLCLPIDHIGGLSVLFRSFEAGGTVVVAPFRHDIVDLVHRTDPTIVSLVPTMVHRLLAWNPESLAGIDTVLVGGGRLPPGVAAMADAAGVAVTTTYGSTETASQVATMLPGEPLRHPGYVGTPLDGFSVSIEQPDSTGAGIIAVEGPAVFTGYVGKAPRQGPHRTSDVGTMDRDGALTILGRSDDVVVSGGRNVSLMAVADTIMSIDGVDGAVVVGVPDDEWGTAVCAIVDSDVGLATIRNRVATILEPHQVPRRWSHGTIPLLANGKPDVATIRASFGAR